MTTAARRNDEPYSLLMIEPCLPNSPNPQAIAGGISNSGPASGPRIVEQLLDDDLEEIERARTLLFLSRAGVLTELKTVELEKMAAATIIREGGDPDDIGIPTLPTSRGVQRIVVLRLAPTVLD